MPEFEESLNTILELRGPKFMAKSFGELRPTRSGVGAVHPKELVKKLVVKMEGGSENTLRIRNPIESEELFSFVDPSKEIITLSESGKFKLLLP